MSKLPAVKVVWIIYQGEYEGLGAAWGEFCQWIEAKGSMCKTVYGNAI
jgi:effector-binding domain-containing protein